MNDLKKIGVIVLGVVVIIGIAAGAVNGKPSSLQSFQYDKSIGAPREQPLETMMFEPVNVTLQNGTFTPVGLQAAVTVNNTTPLGVIHALAVSGELNYTTTGTLLDNGQFAYWPSQINEFEENLTSDPPIWWRWVDLTSDAYGDYFTQYTVTNESEMVFIFIPISENTTAADTLAWFKVNVDIAGEIENVTPVTNMTPVTSVTPVTNVTPVVNFTANTTSGSAPLTVQFNDTSTVATENITAWYWDFGNGYFSILQNPLFTYFEPGNYSISLNVTTESGMFEKEMEGFIQVT